MTQQRRFTKEFEDEAVRLVRASGRSQREIAEDLGIGLSTLVRWLSQSRDRLIGEPDRSGQEDVAGGYALDAQLLMLGEPFGRSLRLEDQVMPALDRLRSDSQESAA
jgi:transposase-like protein